ncbi:MAG: 30S ribosomal protein S7 [Thermoplasmata archaeon]|nr:30S ribosomal protein S7 [Thermoplasmata archaeon]
MPDNITKLFGRYDIAEVAVHDPGLVRYINLTLQGVPHTGGRHASRAFGKQRITIVERLINRMMLTEDFTGKKSKSYKVVEEAFDLIAKRTKQNPLQVLVDALENSAPREEITRLRFGGISVPKAVDVSPSRRLDIALGNICQGAMRATHKSRKSISDCLATEIVRASKKEMESFSVSRKEELERVASSAR